MMILFFQLFRPVGLVLFLQRPESFPDLFDDRLPGLRRVGMAHPSPLRVYHLPRVNNGHLEISRDSGIPLFVHLYQISEFLIEIILQRPLGKSRARMGTERPLYYSRDY
jgi:hypothetical protein